MSKTIKFSPDTEEFLYEILARAINRAIDNGTYVHIPPETFSERESRNYIMNNNNEKMAQ